MDNKQYKRRRYFSEWSKDGAGFDDLITRKLNALELRVNGDLSGNDVQLAGKMFQMGVPDGMVASIIRYMREDIQRLSVEEFVGQQRQGRVRYELPARRRPRRDID